MPARTAGLASALAERERLLRGAIASTLLSGYQVILPLDPMPLAIELRITWCTLHPRCAFTTHLYAWGASSLLELASRCGFSVRPPVWDQYGINPHVSRTLSPLITLGKHLRKHGPLTAAWLSRTQQGWLVHTTEISHTPDSLPRFRHTPGPGAETGKPLHEAARELKSLVGSGAVLWRPSSNQLSTMDIARLLRRTGHPRAEQTMKAVRHHLASRLSYFTDLFSGLNRLLLELLAHPDSRQARKLDREVSEKSARPTNTFPTPLEVLQQAAAIGLGASCQEIQTLLEVQREVFQSSGSAVRSLAAAASPHLAAATALDLMNRS